MNLKINESTFPQELIELDQWLLWEVKENKGRKTKIPVNVNGNKIDVTNKANLTMYSEVTLYHEDESEAFNGIGFSIFKENGIVFIDLDGCINDGVINEEALKVVNDLHSFTEVSQSGTGLHIYVKGYKLGKASRSSHNGLEVEMYDNSRFTAMTGKHLEGTPLHVNENQAALDRFYKKYVDKPTKHIEHEEQDTSNIRMLTVEETKEAMFKAWTKRLESDNEHSQAKAQKYIDLWNGEWEKYTNSKSEATQSLLAELLFWCQKDTGRVLEVIGSMHPLFDNTDSKGGAKRRTWEEYEAFLVNQEMNSLLPNTRMYDPDYSVNNDFDIIPIEKNAEKVGIKPPKPFSIYKNELAIYNEKEETFNYVCRQVPFIENEYKDITNGNVHYKLTYIDMKRNITTPIDVKAEVLHDARKLLKLSEKGFAVNSNNSKLLVRFFDAFLRVNIVPMIKATTRIGHINGKLIHPLRTHGIHIIPNDDETERLLKAFKVKGTLDSYINNVLKPLQDIPIPLFLQFASCSSVLLKPLDIEPFVIETSGLTSTGKTVATETAMAVWGKHSELKTGWNATAPSIDRLTQFLNSFPLMIDDTKKAEYSDKISKVIYTHSDGRSKAKASGSNDLVASNEWSNILFSTGEQSIVDIAHEHGGVGARVITLEEKPFPKGYDYHDHFKRLEGHYGSLGLAFIEQYEADKKRYKQLFEKLEKQYITKANKNDVLERLARPFSVIHLSGLILSTIENSITKEVVNNTLEHIYNTVVSRSKGLDNPKRKLELLLERIEGYPNKTHFRPKQIARNGDFIAFVKEDYLGITSNFINDCGLFTKGEIDKLLEEWYKRGYLVTDKNRLRKRMKARIGNISMEDNHEIQMNVIAIKKMVCEELGFYFEEQQEECEFTVLTN